MPSDSVSSFLSRAQASRLLNPDLIDQIQRQPDLSRMSLGELTGYLEQHRVLTAYQAEMIRKGGGEELHFAGYPIQSEIGPCPGGTSYLALHPSLRTPVVLRRLRGDWFGPLDNAAAYVQRARAVSTLSHPNLLPLLDAGVSHDEAYVVLEPPIDGSNLEALVKEIGPMPGVLAVDYVRQAAAAIRLVHERGGWHGDVRPRNIMIGPLVETPKLGPDGKPLKRPGPASMARVAELGLVPIRPNAQGLYLDLEALSYLPPERLDAPNYSQRGDLYSLGATLFFLLTGRAAFPGSNADEVMLRIRSAEPPPLEAVRPDLAPGLVAVVKQLLAKDPNLRPSTSQELEAKLAPFGRPDVPSPVLAPVAIPVTAAPTAYVATPTASSVFPSAVPVVKAVPTSDESASFGGVAEWGAAAGGSFTSGHSGSFSTTGASAAPVKRTFSAADRAKTRMWFLVGGVLQALAILGWCYLMGCFDSSRDANPTPAPSNNPSTSSEGPKKDPPKKTPPKKKRPSDEP